MVSKIFQNYFWCQTRMSSLSLTFSSCCRNSCYNTSYDINIKGVKIGNSAFKITQVADDTTLFLNDIESLKLALEMLTRFENISGLKLNCSKSEILQFGEPLITKYTLLNLKLEKEKIYALGTWFYKDHKKVF